MRRSELSKKREDSHGRIYTPTVDPRITPMQTIATEVSASVGAPENRVEDCHQEKAEPSCQSALWTAAMGAVDCLAIGLAICDSIGTVLFLNRTADRIIREKDVLRLTDSGGLDTVASDAPSLNSLLQNLLQFADTNKGEGRVLVTAVPRSSGRHPLTLILRLAEQAMLSADATHALVVMLEGNHKVESRESDLYHLYGFTPAETRFANLLMSGKATAEACAELKISHSTGCSHLRNMFKKTGVHRQGELVALLLRSIGMLRFSASKPFLGAGFASIDALSGQNQVNLTALIQRDVDSIL
jgi:DNA-binding CsgD family transcriptional regulator